MPDNFVAFKPRHAQLIILDMESSGMMTSSNILHGVFGGGHSGVLVVDTKPRKKNYSAEEKSGGENDAGESGGEENGGSGGEGGEGNGGGDSFGGLRFVGNSNADWFRENVADGVQVLYADEYFPEENWTTLKDELLDYNKKKGLFYLIYKRGAYSTGYSWRVTEGKLYEFDVFRNYLDEIKKEYEIVSGFLLINLSGTHDLHEDTFSRDATHRWIITLGATNKHMVFAEQKSGVSNEDMSDAMKKYLEENVF